MKCRVERTEDFKETKKVEIVIGGSKYRFTESTNGRLEIHKATQDFEEEYISVFPRVTNVIQIR